jgi:hypothetical protein
VLYEVDDFGEGYSNGKILFYQPSFWHSTLPLLFKWRVRVETFVFAARAKGLSEASDTQTCAKTL